MGVLTETGLKYLAQKIKNKLDNTTYEFQEVESLSNVVDIPNNVLPIASIDKIGGMSYKSKNIFNFSKLKFDSSITSIDYNNKTVTVPATTWFSTSTSTLKDVCPSLNVGDTLYINAVYSNSNVAKAIRIKNTYSFNSPITITEDVLNSPITFLNDNSSYENIVSEIIFSKEPITEYEDYFEGIRDTKVTNIKVVGANLLDLNNNFNITNSSLVGYTPINNGIRVSVLKDFEYDGKIYLGVNKKIPINNFQNGRKYKISANVALGNVSNDLWTLAIYMYNFDGRNKYLSSLENGTQNPRTFTFNFDNNVEYVEVRLYCIYGAPTVTKGQYVDYTNVYFGLDEASTDYIPYHEENIAISSEIQALDGYGLGINEEYNNHIDYDRGMFVKETEKYTFTGNENIYQSTTNSGNDRFYTPDFRQKIAAPSEASIILPIVFEGGLAATSANANYLKNEGIAVDTEGRLFFYKEDIQTIEDWKNYLIGKTLVYPLATPIETDISDLLSNNFIKVFPSGNISFIDQNNYNYPVPNTISFQQKVEKL